MLKKSLARIAALGLSALLTLPLAVPASAQPQTLSQSETQNLSETSDPTVTPSETPSAETDGHNVEENTEDASPSQTPQPAETGLRGIPSQDEDEDPTEGPTEPEPTVAEPFNAEIYRVPFAEADRNCTYAREGSHGAYSDTLCWIDFSSVTTADGRNVELTTEYRDRGLFSDPRHVSVLDPENGPFSHSTQDHDLAGPAFRRVRYGDVKNLRVQVELSGGYVLNALLDISGRSNPGSGTFRPRSRAINAYPFPTWSGAFLGNNGFYELPSDTNALPALYQNPDIDGGDQATTEIRLHDIKLTRNGREVPGYSIVVADAESTDRNERISWSTTGEGFQWLPNIPGATTKSGTMGDACHGSFSPQLGGRSTTASCIAGPNQPSGLRTGTPMLHTAPVSGRSFEVTQTMTGNGLQGVSFGIITAQARVNVEVEDRVLDASGNSVTADDFQASVHLPSRTETANTGSQLRASTGLQTLAVSGSGTRLEFSTDSSGDTATSYTPQWVCTKTNVNGTERLRWPENGSSPTPPSQQDGFSLLGAGEFIDCTVTYTPPYLTLNKLVDNAETEADHTPGDFVLQANGVDAPNSLIKGTAGTQHVQRRPVAVGDYTLTERMPDPGASGNWQYGYAWSDLTCQVPDQSDLSDDALSIDRDEVSGAIDAAVVAVDAGQDIACIYTNTALQPHLEVSKSATPDSGTSLVSGQTVTYELTFDNSAGTAPMTVDHVDHLQDVLDDAELDRQSIVDDGLSVEFDAAQDNSRLLITGTVAARQTKVVAFDVVVSDHDDNADERQDPPNGQHGYMLNNYLTQRLDINDEPIDKPSTCDDSAEEIACTSHPVPAWTVEKGSFPASGARLNRGGNSHYVLTATKLNDATSLQDLVFADDLTHVFKTAGWAPEATVPGGAKNRGIYFLDAQGNTLDASGQINGTSADPSAAYGPDTVGEPEQIDGRWILESDPVDVPAAAVAAELWFAVEAGQNPAGIPASSAWQGPNAPQNGWQFVNYAAAEAAGSQPVQCGTGTWGEGAPDVTRSATNNPVDQNIPEACQTSHELNAGHFTIRKDANGSGIDLPHDPAFGDTDGLWNMVGHEFQIHDDVNGEPSQHPSQYLCRTDYRPDTWNGQFTGHPGDRSLDDWDAGAGDDSETLNEIRAWNEDPANRDDPRYPLPECGVFNAQPEGSGGQTGRYRGMNLQPVLDAGETGQPRDFWLIETKAPTHQISLNGQQLREVPGVQRMAEPIQFRMWPYQDGEHMGGPTWYGKRQLDIPQGVGGNFQGE